MGNKTIQEKEEAFQKAWDTYWHQETTKAGQKKAWDIMWQCVFEACYNIGKTKCYGIRVQDLEGKCLDAACKIMADIGEGRRPKKLSSYVYLYVVGKLYDKKHIEWERSQSFEDTFDNYATETDDDGFICICSSRYNN